jgi:hypothetical protein
MNPIRTPNPIFLRSLLILSSTYNDVFQVISILQALQPYFPTHFHMQAACADHLILDCIAIIIFREQYNLRSTLLCSFLQSLFTPSLLGPEILQSTRFLNILNLTTWQYIPEDSKLHPQLIEVSDYHSGEFEDDLWYTAP